MTDELGRLDDELELLRKRSQVAERIDELEILGQVRDEMLSDPGRALTVFDRVKRSSGIRKPAAFAVQLWRSTIAAEPEPEPAEPEPVLGAPTLATLELYWSQPEETPMRSALGRAMAAAIGAHGGLSTFRNHLDQQT